MWGRGAAVPRLWHAGGGGGLWCLGCGMHVGEGRAEGGRERLGCGMHVGEEGGAVRA